jgi:hypothetical protein
MSDLICRKTMTRCQTPGMCAPHGGCSTSAEAARAALVERAVAPAPASGVPGTIGVKRYIPDGYTQPASRSGTGTHMVESRDGDYVLASDYDMLAQRCRELEGRADALSQELQATLSDWNALVRAIQSPTHGGAVGHAAGVVRERDALRAEVAQLRSLPARLKQIVTTRHESTAALAARVRNTLEDYQ